MLELMNKHPSFHVQMQYDNLVESFGDAVIHTRSYVSKPLLISASLDKMYLWSMSVCKRYQVLGPCMCVPVKRISGHFAAFTPAHECGIPSWLLSSFEAREFPTKRLLETTKLCRKQQTLVGKLSLAEKSLRRNISRTWLRPLSGKNDKHMLVAFCRFFLVFIYKKERILDILTKVHWETTKLCRKQQTVVGNDEDLLETTKLCRKRQGIFCPELAQELKYW
jgi:hypothetical protein